MTAMDAWEKPRPVKLTIDDFLMLADAGAFDELGKTELINGVIVSMSPQQSRHSRVKTRLLRRLADAVDRSVPGFEAWVEVSTAIPPANMPEPDIVVTSFQATGRAPVPAATVALVVEVSDATRRHDLGTKARLYAAAGIAEYWVVDVQGEVIHQLWSPAGRRYRERQEVAFGIAIRAATLDGVEVETGGL